MSTDQELTKVQKLDTLQVLFLLPLLLSNLYPVCIICVPFFSPFLCRLCLKMCRFISCLLARSIVCVCVCALSFSDRQCFLCVGVGFLSVINKDFLVCLKKLLLSIADMCLNCPCSVVLPAFCYLFRRMEPQDNDTFFFVPYNKDSSIKGRHQPQKPENQYCP